MVSIEHISNDNNYEAWYKELIKRLADPREARTYFNKKSLEYDLTKDDEAYIQVLSNLEIALNIENTDDPLLTYEE